MIYRREISMKIEHLPTRRSWTTSAVACPRTTRAMFSGRSFGVRPACLILKRRPANGAERWTDSWRYRVPTPAGAGDAARCPPRTRTTHIPAAGPSRALSNRRDASRRLVSTRRSPLIPSTARSSTIHESMMIYRHEKSLTTLVTYSTNP